MDGTGAPDQRIAVIGRAGRFPAARDVRAYWSLLAEGRAAGRRLTEAELIEAGVSRRMLSDPAYVRVAHILPDMECFDAGFFGFSPREAAILDPQHRHFLECGWEALEDAGYTPEGFDGRIGVFAGSGMQAYLPFNLLTNPDLVARTGLFLLRHTGNDKDFLPTRLSYLLNLTGPSIAVQTACSTSLVAVHMAASSLLNMESDMAIAGGVTIELPHRQGYRYAEGEILSPDGLCRAFDDDSQGTVFGSGAALVVLRRYEDAVADGDDIKAVILASAVNNDGASKASYLAPSEDGQAEAAAEALALSGLDAGAIQYIETHGTGTPIGDPIELSALRQVYGSAPAGSIGIGSVKTNIGHLDTAAGGASLIKVIEALRHRHLPASLNFRTPNSRFDFARSPFRVVAEGGDWASDQPRRAAVNSLGVGGTNAHVIVEEAPARAEAPATGEWRLFPFSARTPEALDRMRARGAAHLDAEAPAVADIAFTLATGRRAFDRRFAVAARDAAGLKQALELPASPLRRSGQAAPAKPRIVFMFPGGGAQYPGAGSGMMATSPVFAAAVEACFARLPASAPADLREMMFGRTLADDAARKALAASRYAIPALFILEYAYAQVLADWGVRPDAILAHSVGEYAGAVVAGALSLDDALGIVTRRGLVMDNAPKGAMTSVPLREDRVLELVGDELDIAAVNSEAATVVSGPLAAIEAFETRLEGGSHPARRIQIDVAAHSRQLDGQLDSFRAAFAGVRFGQASVPMVSSMRGDWARGDDLTSADYWVRHLRQTVRFSDAVRAALDRPDCIVVEVGPGQSLGPLVDMANVTHRPRAVLPMAPRPTDGVDEAGVALAALGGLWANGVEVDLARAAGRGGRRVSLPTYPFEKERHWIEPGTGASAESDEPAAGIVRMEDPADWFETLGWEERAASGEIAPLAGDWLVLAGRDPVSEAVVARLRDAGVRVHVARPGERFCQEDGAFVLRPEADADYDALSAALGGLPGTILSLWALDAGGDGFDAAHRLARRLQQDDAGPGTRLVFVTSGATDAGGGAAAHPGKLAQLGIVRVAPREMPGLTATLVDLPAEPSDRDIRALLDEAAGPSGDDLVALRDGRRFVQTRRAAPGARPEGLARRLRRNGVYLVTGGTGGIGRRMALWLAETAGARLALVSRRATEDADLRRQIEAGGGKVEFLSADATDPAALEAAVERTRAAFGTINGVIHAAGVLDDGPIALQSPEAARAVIAPKLAGAETLSRLLPDGSLDVFAVVSSSSVVLGGIGQAAYVAGNAAVEAVAAARHDGLSIAWGTWRDVGMAARIYGSGEAAPGGTGDGLLGRRTSLDDGGVRFDTMIDPEADWRVAGHVVDGQPILPGMAYVEMAWAAARDVMGSQAFALSGLGFVQPMIFDGLPRRVSIRLQPKRPGFELTVESADGSGREAIQHVRMTVAPVEAPDRGPARLATSAPDLTFPRTATPPRQALIDFGPRWAPASAVRTGEGCAEGDFALPAAFLDDLDRHDIHPALLDMAATVGLAAIPPAPDAVYVPMSIERVRSFAPLPARVRSRAVRVAGEPGRFVAFDVTLFEDSGAPVLVLEHFALRAVDKGALAAGPGRKGLTDVLLATGIRAGEAADLFARVFDHPGRQLVVSPVRLDAVRAEMAERLRPRAKVTVNPGAVALEDPVAARLGAIWTGILGVEGIGLEHDFFALGGHSLLAIRLIDRIRKEFGADLPISVLFENPTLGALAGLLAKRAPDDAPDSIDPDAPWDTTVLIDPGPEAGRRPLFAVGGMGGNVNNLYEFGKLAGRQRPVVGFQTRGVLGHAPHETIEAMARDNIGYLRARQPEGPYILLGYSGGSLTALEMARQLEAAGETVERLIVLDLYAPGAATNNRPNVRISATRRLRNEVDLLLHQGPGQLGRRGWARVRKRLGQAPQTAPEPVQTDDGEDSLSRERYDHMIEVWLKAAGAYRGGPIAAPLTVLRARPVYLPDKVALETDPSMGWARIAASGCPDLRWAKGDHLSMLTGDNVRDLVEQIEDALTARIAPGR